ncbi:Uncharacterized protein OBRU01_11060 [Operophtera brumata]|uniref:TLC domain-containing protein n=1 Tax=Operophtera brumata TaxID=104452 RepID=A0A0L7LDB0_OPEBR|nr:Uncharacterized protein OBRU01_11060 [Operophtera brumata]
MLSRGFFIWSDYLWLPANITWADVSNGPDKTLVYAEAKDYWALIPLVIFGLTLRFLSERFIFSRLGRYLKVSDYKGKEVPPIAKLEDVYCKSSLGKIWARSTSVAGDAANAESAGGFRSRVRRSLSAILDLPKSTPNLEHHQVSSLAKQLDLSERQIERWWRLRRRQDKPTTLVKFSESMWRGTHFTLNMSLGLYAVWGQEWGITRGIWWYYMVASSFYLSLIITQFRDIRRKDFWQNYVHHNVALAQLFGTWVSQTFRIGCLVALLHDTADILLEFGKAAKYAKYHRTVDWMFVLFVCVWVVTRLVLVPFYVFPTKVFSELFLCFSYIFHPLGRYLKISDFKEKASPNEKLEAAYQESSTSINVSSLAKQLDLSERQIERWWRLRRRQDKPTTLVKFSESMWRGTHFTLNMSLGLYAVWGQEWVRDVELCLEGYPHQGLTPGILQFYMITSSFYCTSIISQFRNVRRKAFWQAFIQHDFATLALLYFSWVCQCFRIGCLTIILHDMVDILLEFGKAAKYAKFQRTLDCLFVLFVCVWVMTRLPKMLKPLLDKFWNEDVWLPPNSTWEDLAPGPDKSVTYTDHTHVFYPIPLALVFMVLRCVLEKYWFAPFGRALGIKDTRPRKAPNNPKLEEAYRAAPRTRNVSGIKLRAAQPTLA